MKVEGKFFKTGHIRPLDPNRNKQFKLSKAAGYNIIIFGPKNIQPKHSF